MSDIIPVSHVLLSPVQYDGQEYYTSQYFHQQYLANSTHHAKYQRHAHFARLLKSIEAYGLYVAQGAIVELEWLGRRITSKPQAGLLENSQQIKLLEPLFRENGYRPLTLLNATAQVAMSHHLDDQLSQQLSVSANTLVARHQFGEEDTDLAIIARMTHALAMTRKELRHLAAQQDQLAEATQQNTAAITAMVNREEKVTIEEFVIGRRLRAKMPERLWSAYGRHLGEVCRQRGIDAKPVPVSGHPWPTESSYPLSLLLETFDAWLFATNGQAQL